VSLSAECAACRGVVPSEAVRCARCAGREGRPEKPSDAVRGVTPAALRALVAEMRAGGVGVLTIGDVTVDLTRAPASAPVLATLPAPAGDDDERSPEDVLYRAGAGKRQRLPFGGRS